MRLFSKKIIYGFWAVIILFAVTGLNLTFSVKNKAPLVADEFEYGYLSIPYYYTVFTQDVSAEKNTYFSKIIAEQKSELTFLHKYLALCFKFFGKSLFVFKLSLFPLYLLILFSVFLFIYLLSENILSAFTGLSILVCSPLMLAYSRTLWTPLYSAAFILLALCFYLKSNNFSSVKYNIGTAFFLLSSSVFHYSGILFSGIIMGFILLKEFKQKKHFLYFLPLYFLPQLSSFKMMVLEKTKGCVVGANPPVNLSEYVFMNLPKMFFVKSFFYLLLGLFVVSVFYLLVLNKKRKDNKIYLFLLLMLPSLYLIKINTGVQTHFLSLILALSIIFYAGKYFKKFKYICFVLIGLVCVNVGSFYFIQDKAQEDSFYASSLHARKDGVVAYLNTFFAKRSVFFEKIALLNPDEFSIKTKHPLDALLVELINDDSEAVVVSLNNKKDVEEIFKGSNYKHTCFIVEKSEEVFAEDTDFFLKHIMQFKDKMVLYAEYSDDEKRVSIFVF